MQRTTKGPWLVQAWRGAAGLSVAAIWLAVACDGSVGTNPRCGSDGAPPCDGGPVELQCGAEALARRQAEPLPVPVAVVEKPDVALADPAFEALPGARAEFGRLHGAVYQIEVPDRWNGAVVLWVHGFEELSPQAHATAPDFRRYLIRHGFAWAASSFSSTLLIPGRAADETAALWDFFATKYGRPRLSIVAGLSMGGWAAHIAAARYGSRFQGALGLCGAAGTSPGLRISAELVVAAAYVAGVTQAVYEATPPGKLIDDTLLPALRDPAKRARFESLMVDLTGGPRAFGLEGFLQEESTNWERARQLLAFGTVPALDAPYRLGRGSGVDAAAYNRDAIVLRSNAAALEILARGTEVTGELQMPLVTLHTTGDGQVPVEQARLLTERAARAGRSSLLVTQVIEDGGHCGFTTQEQEVALAGLVDWVERCVPPPGTSVAGGDFSALDREFHLLPRPGTEAAQGIPGALARRVLEGAATLDGVPFDAPILGAVVRADGLFAPCQYTLDRVSAGRYRITILADAENAGCGKPGAEVYLWTYVSGAKLFSTAARAWPTDATTTFDIAFRRDEPSGGLPALVEMAGEAYLSDGTHAPPGTRIEAYVGSTLCGVTATRRSGSFGGYILHTLATKESGCAPGASLTFRIGGAPAIETVPNATRHDLLDLGVR